MPGHGEKTWKSRKLYYYYDDDDDTQPVVSRSRDHHQSSSRRYEPRSSGYHRSSTVGPESHSRSQEVSSRREHEQPAVDWVYDGYITGDNLDSDRQTSGWKWEEQDRQKQEAQQQWERDHQDGEAYRQARKQQKAMDEARTAEEEKWADGAPKFSWHVDPKTGKTRRRVERHWNPADDDLGQFSHHGYHGDHAESSHRHHSHHQHYDRRRYGEGSSRRDHEDRDRRHRHH
ncbi:hypothetical protein F5Y03DRAFT_398276 [Xylaria venustula]|nr:hypothetical protein F5Y03DRAFT_398276 [Xylaria venustula]